jgi:hypothetical protein
VVYAKKKGGLNKGQFGKRETEMRISNVVSAIRMRVYTTSFLRMLLCKNLAFNITTPCNVRHMFGSWLNQFQGKLKRQALTGASFLCWAIWLSRNNVVFDKSPTKSLLQVLL